MRKYPELSIIIVSLNSQRTLKDCLAYIKKQTYPKIKEVLLVDGGSKDNTLIIAKNSGLPIKIIKAAYENNQEARRAIGIQKAKNEICAMIDTDNFITDKNWLKAMVEPLVDNKLIAASQTLRYSAPKNSSLLNRYFGLLGSADPVAYYLGKSDRLSWAYDDWRLLGQVIADKKNYYIVKFNPDNFPTVGANGIVFKRSMLLKSNWKNPENYFHTDVFVDIARKGYDEFAIVKNEIFHNTADNLISFLRKRKKYMKLHHQNLQKSRRFLVYNPKNLADVAALILLVFISLTFVVPLIDSFRGYLKKKDAAWFLHPFVTFGITVVYAQATIYKLLRKINV
ncbi:hypothetical protein A2774_03050 [Candidatus Roizmanbacteria bacterium RIFCSPHIGHO2_01_FULL_39_12c]|uniref:Glycosyltransferase 2-like domain-containing protein n=1 Tax=Candidatus Roizmanbacteria bacterium RIFCSPHIGHO2_01_FULL_39_12c TaxID=1802031 RepID=A0A1F7GC32_9BACT|nr:MAG: hypothetical protein A2774_03050 [Candidatus Roizmanbacteria bacterium RIFCSPHIGHO2_01_FULL_39_12c]OGK47423.1 MAG: hypothetical protein A2963_04690 [Candidatus Roizmanbacteria bacterium RIFCSPLOWO2_01_FULL_40_13]